MNVRSPTGFDALLGGAVEAVNRGSESADAPQPTPSCSITSLLDLGSMTAQQLLHLRSCPFCARRAATLEALLDEPDE